VISDASTQPRADEDVPTGATVGGAPAGDAGAGDDAGSAGTRRPRRRGRADDRTDDLTDDTAEDRAQDARTARSDVADDGMHPAGRRSGRFWAPLVAVLAVLLLLLLGAVGYLWFSRPSASSVRTADYVAVLTQGRQDVVDLTSFDYQTIDQDIAQVRKVSVGTLQKDSVDLLQKGRQQFTDQQVVVNTEVVSAAVTQAGDGTGRLTLVIQSTQRTKASATPKISRYRIQADLQKSGDRWLLSGITGR
jgi:Mce-associated membrane protein